MTTAYEYLIKKGLKEGIDLGKKIAEQEAQQTKMTLIKNLLIEGFSEIKVASLVGTSVEDVQRVQSTLTAHA